MTVSCENMPRQDTLPGVEENPVTDQDFDMTSALDSASGEEILRQGALVPGHQAIQQDGDIGSDGDEEEQVARLLEDEEATSATGKHKLLIVWRTDSLSYDLMTRA